MSGLIVGFNHNHPLVIEGIPFRRKSGTNSLRETALQILAYPRAIRRIRMSRICETTSATMKNPVIASTMVGAGSLLM